MSPAARCPLQESQSFSASNGRKGPSPDARFSWITPPPSASLLGLDVERYPAPVGIGDILADKYRVEAVLGRGGMGVVVAAQHLQLGQRVAIKFLLVEPAKNSDAVERFLREARAAVRIQSEHVARVIDVGTLASGAPYMVMEFLVGCDLAELIRTEGAQPISKVADLVLQAGEAIAEAHSKGIIHRDLKPANLFLTERPDGTSLVKVLDFGISKSTTADELGAPQASMTATATVMGSPLYMSPEQMRSTKNVDARTDIWSLGVIVFELLTGRPVYEAESLPGLCAMIASIPLHRYVPYGQTRRRSSNGSSTVA